MKVRISNRKVVTCTVPEKIYAEIKEAQKSSSIKFGYLISRGWEVVNGREIQLDESLQNEKIEKLQRANERMQRFIIDLNHKIDTLGGGRK